MKHLTLLLITLLLAFATLSAAPRVALVIGNNAYRDLPPNMQLTSPVNDAQDVAAALQRLGYTVVGGVAITDATREQLTAATEQFATAARGAEAAVFYFSGHGIQVGEDNYLLPSDTPKLTGLSMLKNRAVLLRDSVMVALEEAGAASKVIILDCCRDNPFSAQLETALAQVGNSVKTKSVGEISGYGPGFYLAFATSPGSTAADRNGARNSPFTAAILKALPDGAGKDIDFFFRDVKALLPDDQVSWTNHSIKGSFALVPGAGAAAVPMAPVPAAPPAAVVDPLAGVSKEKPHQNSLGMAFVPAGTPGVLFSVWETRVKDFEAFVEDSGHDAISGNAYGTPASTLDSGSKGPDWKQAGGSWRDPRFPQKQSGEHPVVCVSYLDAEAFCAWLTKKERASGKIPAAASYRLPSDSEWSRACGGSEYPWGETYPPKSGDGNYLGEEGMVGAFQGASTKLSEAGFRDGAARTSVVGMFKENRFGLHDMGGNVWEWCDSLVDTKEMKLVLSSEGIDPLKLFRVRRGSAWTGSGGKLLLSTSSTPDHSMSRVDSCGFRVVLSSSRPSEDQAKDEASHDMLIAMSNYGTVQQWMDVNGRVISATFVRIDGLNVILQVTDNGNLHAVPITRLSQNSQSNARLLAKCTDEPFFNSLEMAFVPAGTPGVLFSVWETRVKDFEAFVEDSGHDAISVNEFGMAAATLESGGEMQEAGGSWRDPRFPAKQSGEHPVVCVSYLDAEAFCAWLTKKERASGKIPATASYRLPSDSEWSQACGETKYPWGDTYPPNSNDGNYCGAEAMIGALQGLTTDLSDADINDRAARTSIVGMFKANRYGLHDMGGNVAELCSTWYTPDLNDEEHKKSEPLLNTYTRQRYRVLRGSSWSVAYDIGLRSSFRNFTLPGTRYVHRGFRVVLLPNGD